MEDPVSTNNHYRKEADRVTQEFTLIYPCGCSYYIGKHYTGQRFCDIHNSVIIGVSKYIQEYEH